MCSTYETTGASLLDGLFSHFNRTLHASDEQSRLTSSPQVPYHKQLALPALHAKKSVFVEWPLATGVQEAEELAALAKKQGVKTAVGLQVRLLPSVRKAKSIIDSGSLGRIIGTTLIASGSMVLNLPEKSNYINDRNSGANMVTIPTIHALDPVCHLLGEFKWLNATTATTFQASVRPSRWFERRAVQERPGRLRLGLGRAGEWRHGQLRVLLHHGSHACPL